MAVVEAAAVVVEEEEEEEEEEEVESVERAGRSAGREAEQRDRKCVATHSTEQGGA